MRFTTQEFNVVGIYTEDLKKNTNRSKLRGGSLPRTIKYFVVKNGQVDFDRIGSEYRYCIDPFYLVFRNVQVLLGKDNCSGSAEDSDGMTPLHIACQSGHTKIAGLLLDRGADVDLKNAEGNTPLNLAVKAKCIETSRLLLSK